MEQLEARRLLATFMVTNVNNAGTGSLFDAISRSDNTPGPNTIDFAIPGNGPFTIRPTFNTTLPSITNPVTIDATTQRHGAAGPPLVEINGAGDGTNSGFFVKAGGDGSTIRGFVIDGFGGAGISLAVTNRVSIQGNYLGTDPKGAKFSPNLVGIRTDNSSFNTIGGADVSDRNVISGNKEEGIVIENEGSSKFNTIQDNYVGTTADGTLPLGNGFSGIAFREDVPGRSSGGAGDVIAGNVIAANSGSRQGQQAEGLELNGTMGALVVGNIIGLNANGTSDGNANVGVFVFQEAPNTTIGGTTSDLRNVISANLSAGIFSQAQGTLVQGNYVGTSVDGETKMGNGGAGVFFFTGADNGMVGGTVGGARNVISGNVTEGVFVAGISDQVQGNYIGTDAAGVKALGNGQTGVGLAGQADSAVIGGTTAAARNVISANGREGVSINTNPTTKGTIVEGNRIGVDASGTRPLGNGGAGVSVQSQGNTIGGTASGAGNIISANGTNGVELGGRSMNNLVQGDMIGTNVLGIDPSGTDALGNRGDGVSILPGASGNTIGGSTPESLVVIAGNQANGVSIAGRGNLILGDYIGVDALSQPLGNIFNGVTILSGASGNTVGGSTPGSRVVIAGNQANGVSIAGQDNLFQGDYIGTDVSGVLPIRNLLNGVSILSGASGNTIGGTTPGSRVVIAGNQANGVSIAGQDNTIQGDDIGTDALGLTAVGNAGAGVAILTGASGNGVLACVVSGNQADGVSIAGPDNLIAGDFIGVDKDGNGANGLGNTGQGVNITAGDGNTIGGTAVGSGDIISSNSGGIAVNGAGFTKILGDRIGVGAMDDRLGNFGIGVLISDSHDTQVGGSAAGAANVIAFNSTGVFVVSGPNNSILGNRIFENGLGIDIGPPGPTPNTAGGRRGGPNDLQNFPILTLTKTSGGKITIDGTLNSSPDTTFAIQFFADRAYATGYGQGRTLLGQQSVTTDAAGNVSFRFVATTVDGQGPFVSATATDPSGNTSEFSPAITEISYTVTTTADDGDNSDPTPGSLRAAILNANRNPLPGGRLIDFAIPGRGPFTIAPTSALPALTSPVVIDGFTQAGSRPNSLVAGDNSVLEIALDGVAAGNLVNGLTLDSGRITIRGLEIVDFGGAGIVVNVNGSNAIVGDDILANGGNGVSIVNSVGNMIGGSTPGSRDVISGNRLDGVQVAGAPSAFNFIVGDYIGTNPQGTLPFGNGQDGVRVVDAGPSNAVLGDVVSGNGAVGVEIAGKSTRTAVLGNLIGLDAAGASPIGNFFGVLLNASEGNTIGGTFAGARNVISGNLILGVEVFAIAPGGGNDAIQGNFIGTSADGSVALGNGDPSANVGVLAGTGVFINNAALVTIGGTTPGAGNLISGNLKANVSIFGQADVLGPVLNIVQGNTIGALLSRPLGSLRPTVADPIHVQNIGVVVNNSAGNFIEGNTIADNLTGVEVIGILSSNAVTSNEITANYIGILLNNAVGDVIGGTNPGEGNRIVGNATLGVAIIGALSSGNLVQGNMIVGNGSTGVYLESAAGNTIGGRTAAASNLIADNGTVKPSRNGVGVYFNRNAAGNTIERNTIRGNTAYGVFLFNSAGNVPGVARTGPGANKFSGNGVADFREFTGPETQTTKKKKSTPKGPVAGTPHASKASSLASVRSTSLRRAHGRPTLSHVAAQAIATRGRAAIVPPAGP